jgi:hypothetical protein
MSLGAGVIGDIYKLEERGTGIGIFFGVRDGYLDGLGIDAMIFLRLRFLASLLPRFLEVGTVNGLVCMQADPGDDLKQVPRHSTGHGAICTTPLLRGACLRCFSYIFSFLRRAIQAQWASIKFCAREGSISHGSIP